jgi:heme-degrading monooxygenase HmoA
MLVILWEYVARKDRLDEFESFYRPDGPWTELFREAPGFVSTTLWRDVSRPRRFVVADRWTSNLLYEDFKRTHSRAYAELSERGRHLIEREVEIGRFDLLE